MPSVVNIYGDDFGLFDNNPSPIPLDVADRYLLVGQHAITLSRANAPIPMDANLRGFPILLTPLNLGGSERPQSNPPNDGPVTGVLYP